MTTTPTDPTTDDLTEHLDRWVANFAPFMPEPLRRHWVDNLLTSGPLAGRLNALARVEALRRDLAAIPGDTRLAAALLETALRGDR